MSQSKHTPGPWWSPDGKTIKQDYRPLTEVGGCIIAGVMGGSTSGPYFIEVDEEVDANTRLIAAAPDLLDGLILASTQLRKYETLHRAKGTYDSIAKAEVNAQLAARFEATIAKARGEK